eukprot:SAG31_NODE_832_length_11660_cov_2.612091_7_plen_143_part_00
MTCCVLTLYVRGTDLSRQWDVAMDHSLGAAAEQRDASMFNIMGYVQEKNDLLHYKREQGAKRQKIMKQLEQERAKASAQAQKQETVTIELKCPKDVREGDTLRIRAKGHKDIVNKVFDVQVPKGVTPGKKFNVQFNVQASRK